MQRMLLAVALAGLLASCAERGPVYRGAPPPGITHKQYVQMLTGNVAPVRSPPDNSPAINTPNTAASPD
jgi:hypothetical protein